MFKHRLWLVLSCSLMLSAMIAGEANALGLPPPFLEYAAKFTCGRVPPAGGDTDAVVGVYATSINIHNPQADATVEFFKKIVIAPEEGEGQAQIFVLTPNQLEALRPDLAEYVDCPLIFKISKMQPGTRIEGFVVLEIKTSQGQPQLSLDVVGTYSARASTGEASSLDVVVYNPKPITQ